MLNKNQEIRLSITSLSVEGAGIGKTDDGITIFVSDALPGDEVLAHIIKVKKTYAIAITKELITPSPFRVEALCPVAKKCGGCTFQHLSYAKQLEFKQDQVKACLERIGGIKNPPMEEIIGAENIYHYRNKAQFPVGSDSELKPVIGFYRRHSHDVVPNTDCAIQASEDAVILSEVQAFLRDEGISSYDEETCKGLVRHIFTRIGFASRELMVCLICNGSKLPKTDKLVDRLKSAADRVGLKLESLLINVNKDNTNVIIGKETYVIYGRDHIEDSIGDIKYHISMPSFYQVNPEQTRKLYDKAKEYASLTGNEVVWDLYCGIGTISLYLANEAKMVYGVEIVPEAIENARENARINSIDNAEFYVGAAEDVADTLPAPDVIVVDPPRKGCDEKLLDTILRVKPGRIVYVSCDPATLARDLNKLISGGYELKHVQPVDQFCQTVHVETVCLLVRRNSLHIDIDVDVEEMLQEKRGQATLCADQRLCS